MNNNHIFNVNLIACKSGVVITGGTSSQFLKADGTTADTTYFPQTSGAALEIKTQNQTATALSRCSQEPSARYRLQETLSHGLHLGHTQQTQYQSLLIKPQALNLH